MGRQFKMSDSLIALNQAQVPVKLKENLFKPYGVSLYKCEEESNCYLNRLDRRIVEVYVKTLSVKACLEAALELKSSKHITYEFVRLKLKKDWVRACVEEGLRTRALTEGWTAEKWKGLGLEGMLRVGSGSRMDFKYWREMGLACGFYKK